MPFASSEDRNAWARARNAETGAETARVQRWREANRDKERKAQRKRRALVKVEKMAQELGFSEAKIEQLLTDLKR